VVVVDWSDFEPGHQWPMLKAAVSVGGRVVTIYERVFPSSATTGQVLIEIIFTPRSAFYLEGVVRSS
jgi:hypothetical protein